MRNFVKAGIAGNRDKVLLNPTTSKFKEHYRHTLTG